MKASCIIACAGSGSRCALGYNKLLYEVCGKTILEHTLKNFIDITEIKEIILSASAEDYDKVKAIALSQFVNLPIKVVSGGSTRSLSIKNCLSVASDKMDIVIIHDGARPYIERADIMSVMEAAYKYNAAVITHPIIDTLKRIDEDGNMISESREKFCTVSTPQAFNLNEIIRAYGKIDYNSVFTDDTEVYAQYIRTDIIQIPASNHNKKITTMEDIKEYEKFMSGCQMLENDTYKVGVGYDVHRMVEGRELIIGGVKIPYEKGLLGHSDADVLLHAIMDSVLSAMGEKDIGNQFPDSDNEYKDIDSKILLGKVMEMVNKNNYKINNISATVIMEKPKLSIYIDDIKKKISNITYVPLDNIGIMATTTEKLGIVGRGEGVACYAICSLVGGF